MGGQDSRKGLGRRAALGVGVGAGLAALVPAAAAAQARMGSEAEFRAALKDAIGDRQATAGRVTLDLPPLAESGNSVPLTVRVDSPMTEADHVRRVILFAPRNPRPRLVTLHFGPRCGRAEASTKVRLSGTQTVLAYAEMSDGSLWLGQKRVDVTIGACESLMFRN
jgi:sulfur-oxidizing protein SoxY